MAGQRIGFAVARDGVRVAYAVSGRGPALVMTPHWFSHLKLEWDSPVYRHWLAALSARYTLIRYDLRGSGLSDRGVDCHSLDTWLDDLEAVGDAAGVDNYALFGVCQGGPLAIAAAARRPERVRALVLYGTYARCGPLGTRPPEEVGVVDAMTRLDGGLPLPLREVVARLFLPDAGPAMASAFVALQQASVTAADAARINATHAAVDVTALTERVRTPTLVLHLRDDVFVPFEQGRLLAALIRGSRFVPLDGRNHVLLPDESAWSHLLAEVVDFLGGEPAPAVIEVPVTVREREVLALVAQGRTNDEIARNLFLSVRTVERHLSNVYAKLGVNGKAARAAAAVLAAHHS